MPQALQALPTINDADFSCPVSRVRSVESISGADKIDLAHVMGYQVIVPRGRYKSGDLAAFVPEGALLPDSLVASIKGTTKLAGRGGNRTKPFLLRGVLSEGLLVGPLPGGKVGTDCAPMLGITKWIEEPPHYMRGECIQMGRRIVPYHIANYRRSPGAIAGREDVEVAEKIHGSFCAVSFVPGIRHPALWSGDTLVYSKGLGGTGLVFKDNEFNNAENVYLKTVKALDLRRRIIKAFGLQPATIFGEVYGPGVQDLTYGRDGIDFALFDVYLGTPERGRFLSRDEMNALGSDVGDRVPVLYRGRFDAGAMRELASGETMIGGTHIREGVVVTPVQERGRPRVKYISPEYLTRANGTERQ